ncbi:glycosyltransferase [soil metagenome]
MLAGELIDRGHRVTWIAQADVKALIRDERIGFAAVGDKSHPADSLKWVHTTLSSGPFGIRRVIRDVAGWTDMLCRDGPSVLKNLQVDALIADQMEAAGGLLADGLGLPCVSVACALPVNREPRVPLPVMPWPYAWDDFALQRNQVSTRVYDYLMAPHARVIEGHSRAFRSDRRSTLSDCLSPLLQLSQTTAGFDFPREHLPRHFHHVGPLRTALGTEPALDCPVFSGTPFVFASLGTLQGGRFTLFRRIAKACRSLGVQLLVAHCDRLRPDQAAALVTAGATWVTGFAPQRAALEAADVAITHAGLNTVLDALTAGTPMLALPITFDQPGVAARVREAGAGIVLSPTFASTSAIRKALLALLNDASYFRSAARLGAEVSQAGGVQKAVDLIETAIVKGPIAADDNASSSSLAFVPAHREARAA